MDISSTTSSQAVSSSNSTSTSSTSSAKTSDKDSSFKAEMDKASGDKTSAKSEDKKTVENKKEDKQASVKTEDATSKNAENKTVDVVDTQNKMLADDLVDNVLINPNAMLSAEIDFTNIQVGELRNSAQDILLNANKQLADIAMMTDTPVKVDYTNISMDYDDAQFFTELVKDTDKTLQNVVADLQNNQLTEHVAKHVKVSATLMNALSETVKTNQPFRIDFDKDISVIIRVDKDGALTAKFIPGDRAVEEYLRQNISTLRQRFDDEDIAYNELSYTRQQNREQQNRRNNKENEHE